MRISLMPLIRLECRRRGGASSSMFSIGREQLGEQELQREPCEVGAQAEVLTDRRRTAGGSGHGR